MFHLLVSGMQAYNQVGFFFGSLICLGIGGLLAGGAFYWRVHAVRATGTIIGVIPSGNTYAAVYRYALPNGETHVARSNDSSNIASGKETGRVVRLLISPHNPSDARQANDWSLEIIGLAFLVPGLWLGWTALTAYPITPMTFVIAAAMALYFSERAVRIFHRNGPHVSIAQWLAMVREHDGASDIDMSEVRPIEQLVDAKGRGRELAKQRRIAPIVGLFAAGFLVASVYEGMDIVQFETQGVRTAGKVIDIVGSDSSDGHWTYHALVRFRASDANVQFTDPVGGNPPSLSMGEQVSVLYFPESPASAMVDRGLVMNALVPLMLLAAGVFLGWLSFAMLRGKTGVIANPGPGSLRVPAE